MWPPSKGAYPAIYLNICKMIAITLLQKFFYFGEQTWKVIYSQWIKDGTFQTITYSMTFDRKYILIVSNQSTVDCIPKNGKVQSVNWPTVINKSAVMQCGTDWIKTVK